MTRPKKRKMILCLLYDVGLIAFAVAATAAGTQLSDRVPLVAIFFFIIALIYYIIGVVDLHQRISGLESIDNKEQKDKR